MLGSSMEKPENSKTLFIVNPISGSGKKKKAVEAIERFYGGPYEIVYTKFPGHAVELARDSHASLVVAVGGDGTVSEVASGIVSGGDPSKTLGIIPCGSGDGLALHLGLSRNPARAVETLNNPGTVMMDYATIKDDSSGRPEGAFFCTAGVGFDADVAEAFAVSGHRRLWNYIACALRLWRNFKPGDYRVVVDGKEISGKASMITVGNASQWGNGARIAPLASVTDGVLDVSFSLPFSTFRIPVLAVLLLTGRLFKARELKIIKGKEISIYRTSGGAAHYDGDPCVMGGRIDIKVCPAAIQVVVPPDMVDSI
ncbi:MAG: diacylglycerol kinase family lipid kinase [Bacteroidales bacterium]|nr:diacylglycerol kinase family lipid kinase [Bacteroidales bacterium]